jgi:hypothetical protein
MVYVCYLTGCVTAEKLVSLTEMYRRVQYNTKGKFWNDMITVHNGQENEMLYCQCSNCTKVFPWFSMQHNAWWFQVSESVRTVGVQRTEGLRKNEGNGVCPCNVSYGIQMKEKLCLTGLLLRTNHGCITTNPNQSVLQCNRNIPVHLLVQPKSLRLCHQLGSLCMPCFGILGEYC